MSSKSGSGVAAAAPSDHRRKWDRDQYERQAQDRIRGEIDALRNSREEREEPVQRELLKPRSGDVKLETNLNKSQVISKTGSGESAGYYCNICDCVVKDSINYLDHINGKKHQRNLGMSMRVKRSSLDDVKQRFEALKKKDEAKKKEYNFEERVKEIKEEEEKVKAYRRERKRKKREESSSSHVVDADDDMAQMMGFSGFSGGKKAR